MSVRSPDPVQDFAPKTPPVLTTGERPKLLIHFREGLTEYENPQENTNCVVFVLLFGKGTFNEALNIEKEIVRHGISIDDVTTMTAH